MTKIDWKNITFSVSIYSAIGFLGLSVFLFNQLTIMQVNHEIAVTTDRQILTQVQMMARMQRAAIEKIAIPKVQAAETENAH